MTPPEPTNPLALAKQQAGMAQAKDALKLLGSLVGSKMYAEVEPLWANRFALWFARGDCRLEDVAVACEALSTPDALARIKASWDLNPELAREIADARNRREERERQERERRRANQPESVPERRKVLAMLEGVGTQIGRGRSTPRGNTRGNEEEAGRPQAAERPAAVEDETGPAEETPG